MPFTRTCSTDQTRGANKTWPVPFLHCCLVHHQELRLSNNEQMVTGRREAEGCNAVQVGEFARTLKAGRSVVPVPGLSVRPITPLMQKQQPNWRDSESQPAARGGFFVVGNTTADTPAFPITLSKPHVSESGGAETATSAWRGVLSRRACGISPGFSFSPEPSPASPASRILDPETQALLPGPSIFDCR